MFEGRKPTGGLRHLGGHRARGHSGRHPGAAHRGRVPVRPAARVGEGVPRSRATSTTGSTRSATASTRSAHTTRCPTSTANPGRSRPAGFRRTIAWHIAHQPFGVVAGKIQYKHAQVAIFEGYAGTSASGFPAEIEDQRRLGAPGVVPRPLRGFQGRGRHHAAPGRAVHPYPQRARRLPRPRRRYRPAPGHARQRGPHLLSGVLNDCYFDPANALCLRHLREAGKPADQPVLNHCQPALCRNSCVTAEHAPAIRTVISGNRELLSIQKLSAPQRTALQQHIGAMESMLAPLGGPA